MGVELRGPSLAVRTCARRLGGLGARASGAAEGGDGDEALVLQWDDGPAAGADLDVDLTWYGPAQVRAVRGSEPLVQALSGLMQVHGRDADGPRRIGIEVASVAAGVLAAHAVAAALIGRARGADVTGVESSVLEAGALLVSHRVAAATAGNEWVPAPPGSAPGPPFCSSDGVWFEIETMDPSAWRAFWERLDAADVELARAWTLFRSRYFRGTCSLPPGLHEATAAHPLAEIHAAAQAHGLSVCPLRGYDQVLDEFGSWDGMIVPQPLGQTLPPPPPPGPRRSVAQLPPDALPLAGLHVVEATSRLQGPLAGRLLQLLGARVTRVEPLGGDLSRTVPPLVGDTGSFFLCFNRGKDTVELDLSKPPGRDALRGLLADADVFLQNWRPGKAAEWGLDGDILASDNPALVYAHASGWGDRADLSHLVGTDYLVQAYAAVGAGVNPVDEPPFPSRALLTDYLGALVTCEAILSGLYQRERSGRGQCVEPSLLAGALALQAHVLEGIAGGCEEKGRRGGRPVWTRLDRPLPTADGALAVDVSGDDDVGRLCAAAGVRNDVGSSADVEAAVAARLGSEDATGWEGRLRDAGVACVAVRTDLAALPSDPELSVLFEPLEGGAAAPVAPWRLHA